jgi:hypothetical protein
MTYQEEQLLMSLAGRAAIADLTARLNRAQDAGDANAWISGFLPEGELLAPGRDPARGHSGLLGYFRSLPTGRVHLSVESVIEVAGVKARQDCRYLVLAAVSSGSGSLGSGIAVESALRQRDDLVYERGDWYVSKREFLPLETEGG